MAERHGTAIEWTHIPGFKGETWNPIRADAKESGKRGWFCVHASPGCENCYAETINVNRFGNGLAYTAQNRDKIEIVLDGKTLLQPLHWKQPRAIFVCSMSDLFGEFVPDEMIDKVFAVAALCPQHIFIVLTKRAKRMHEYITHLYGLKRGLGVAARALPWRNEIAEHEAGDAIVERLRATLPNVWLGVSVEDQRRADERIPELLATPAAVRFLSCEPLLGGVDLYHGDPDPRLGGVKAKLTAIGEWWEPGDAKDAPPRKGVDWVICGGESGKNARPMHPDWARSLRDQCAAAAVPFFFKQWGEWAPGECAFVPQTRTEDCADWDGAKWWFGAVTPKIAQEMHYEDEPDVWRFGKRKSGRLLDGIEHSAFPLPLAAEGER